MTKTHQWINTGLLVICAGALAALWVYETQRNLGVQCIEPQDVVAQTFRLSMAGYCIAVVPSHLDRDYPSQP